MSVSLNPVPVSQSGRWSSRVLNYLTIAATNSADYSRRHIRSLAALTIVVPCAYAVDYLVGRPYFDTLTVRLAAFALVLPLLFPKAIEARLGQTTFAWYFVGLIAYVLPFTFGLMLMLNAASAPPTEHIETLWSLQYIISLFLFIQLIHNGILATVLWTLSTVAAALPLLLLNSVNWGELERVMLYPVTGYLTALVFGIITNRNADYIDAEKLRAASAIGGNIAHELRTPLASIRSLARSVRKHSESLADGYRKAKEHGLPVNDLTTQQVDGLSEAISIIEREVEYSNTIIDMLLLNTSDGRPHYARARLPSIAAVANEAISRFPFANSHEIEILELRVDTDFPVTGSNLLLVHVFFNLLKNAVYYAQRTDSGSVSVVVGRNCENQVEVTDTGPGLSSIERRRVFDRFYTSGDTSQGAGIGLSFCKMVMESIGGEIHCDSREGQYTTFRLVFPPVSHTRGTGNSATAHSRDYKQA